MQSSPQKTLSELLGCTGGDTFGSPLSTLIKGLTSDSRAVQPGYLFAAFNGSRFDGRAFIEDAIQNGAAAILTDPDAAIGSKATIVRDRFPRARLAHMAANFYGRQPKCLMGVTGTNGKTSVAEFVRQIWAGIGLEGASFGTLGLRRGSVGRSLQSGALTTADPILLHETLWRLTIEGVEHSVIEASSHGLDQGRVDGCRFKVAGFTNLTRDHLDYHITEDAYSFAKARLFADLLDEKGTAVVCLSGERAFTMADIAKGRGIELITVGEQEEAIWRVVERTLQSGGQRFTVVINGIAYQIDLPLIGEFQMWNWLVAAAMVVAGGADLQKVFSAASHAATVPGRMDLVGKTQKGGHVLVDFAHTPDGLETVLKSVRSHAEGNVALVFGCGGNRDVGKRAEMGAIANKLADQVIVTDDNPRQEDPALIRKAIMAAAPKALEVGDRALAIEKAITCLGEGDILVIAGKGHEEGQIVGNEVLPFNDIYVAQAVLAEER